MQNKQHCKCHVLLLSGIRTSAMLIRTYHLQNISLSLQQTFQKVNSLYWSRQEFHPFMKESSSCPPPFSPTFTIFLSDLRVLSIFHAPCTYMGDGFNLKPLKAPCYFCFEQEYFLSFLNLFRKLNCQLSPLMMSEKRILRLKQLSLARAVVFVWCRYLPRKIKAVLS